MRALKFRFSSIFFAKNILQLLLIAAAYGCFIIIFHVAVENNLTYKFGNNFAPTSQKAYFTQYIRKKYYDVKLWCMAMLIFLLYQYLSDDA